MRLIHFYRFSLEKCGKIWKNRPFFRADMAGLGKYCMGGYGRIWVYRVKQHNATCPLPRTVSLSTNENMPLLARFRGCTH